MTTALQYMAVGSRPILFTPEMVRAIVSGRKTQTRRVKKMPSCPYGNPGDLLRVREPFSAWFGLGEHWYETDRTRRTRARLSNLFYRATHPYPDDDQKWVPSIYMPRWASRLYLQIVERHEERLLDITTEDAIAEGFSTQSAFFELWDKINKQTHPTADNPPVWVVQFKVLACEHPLAQERNA